jgi:formate-dependent phosphoribosylglycinamide formyltransferase (GAR transformylase)
MPKSQIACTDLGKMRELVQQEFDILAVDQDGQFWLPLVVTARGTLYGEVIAQIAPDPLAIDSYIQPLHLTDALRQPLYRLGKKLLALLPTSPGVYLLQFGLTPAKEIRFDRLIPFPDLPAIATIATQTPNLFECHWRCLSGLPIHDLKVEFRNYFVLDSTGSVVVSAEFPDC